MAARVLFHFLFALLRERGSFGARLKVVRIRTCARGWDFLGGRDIASGVGVQFRWVQLEIWQWRS